MPQSLLGKIGKSSMDLAYNNMILSNYKAETSKPLGVSQVGIVVGTNTRPTLFMVVLTKPNYNMLMGREGFMELDVYLGLYIRGSPSGSLMRSSKPSKRIRVF